MVWTEARGFDSIWLTEHHFIDYGLSVSPAVLAAAAAMRTRRVRIGLAAATLPFHDPIRLAVELAIVDILSEGRLDVGRGARPPPSAACPCSTPCCVDRSSSSPRARDTYVKACEKAGRSAAEIASRLDRWAWYQESLRRFLIPERIDRVHPLLQPGFRAMEERFAQVSWERWSRRASPSAPPTSSPRGSTSSGVWGSAKCSAG